MSFERKLSAFFSEIVKEAKVNPDFAKRLEQAVETVVKVPSELKKTNKRAPAVLDPFLDFEKGEQILRATLAILNIEQLRDVIAQYGMDRAKLAMKWKDTKRIIDLIVTTVAARSRKGDAFRTPESQAPAPIEGTVNAP